MSALLQSSAAPRGSEDGSDQRMFIWNAPMQGRHTGGEYGASAGGVWPVGEMAWGRNH